MSPQPPDLIWGTLITAGLTYEALALVRERHDATLSHRTRMWSRVHTPTGRAVFALGWTAFAAWFLQHILDPERSPSRA